MAITVFRISKSQYLSEDFFSKEKKSIEAIAPDIQYTHQAQNIAAGNDIILLTTSNTVVDEIPEIIMNRVKLIIHPNSGHDNFTKSFLSKWKIPIINGNTIRAKAVSEYILSALFSQFSHVSHHHHWDDTRSWDRDLISNQDVLIIGHGHIGSIVYNSLSSLVEKITVVDPVKFSADRSHFKNQLKDEYIEKCTVLILCCDLNESTHKLLNNEFFKKLGEKVLIINAARGKIIDQDSLIYFLSKNPKSFAVLDVFEKEPFSPSAFVGLKNIFKTSHIAGVHNLLEDQIVSFTSNVVSDYYKNASNVLAFMTLYHDMNIAIHE